MGQPKYKKADLRSLGFEGWLKMGESRELSPFDLVSVRKAFQGALLPAHFIVRKSSPNPPYSSPLLTILSTHSQACIRSY